MIRIALAALYFVASTAGTAIGFAEEASAQELHPGHSWMQHLRNKRGEDCCHDGDCKPFEGNPVRVEGGWKFGTEFVPDSQIIPADQIPIEFRGDHVLCIYKPIPSIRCGYVAATA